MARLRSIRIAGWKSIRDIDPKLELGAINVLIGGNGSGKSNFVSFFKMMNELVGERLQTYFAQAGGADSVSHLGSKITPNLEAELDFDSKMGRGRYSFQLRRVALDALVFSREQLDIQDPGSDRPKTIWMGGTGHTNVAFSDSNIT